jgi:hypothetical protein
MPPKPAKCPGASSIASFGVDVVESDKDGTWVAGVLSNNYDTQNAWTFALGKISARNANEARDKAMDSLGSLSFRYGPVAVEQYNVWACLYGTAEGYMGVTITPQLSLGLKSAAHLAK